MRNHRFKVILLIISLVILTTGIIYSQGSGTPSTLIVKTDANGYLVVSSAAQTSPVTSGTFSSRTLKTDASNNLLVVLTGGAFTSQFLAPTTPTDCSAPQYSFVGDTDTGVGYGGTNSVKLCNGGLSVFYNNIATYNLGVGLQALNSPTSGSENTAVGVQALFSNTTGNQNVGVGTYANYANLTGIQNTAVGYLSLRFNTVNGQTAIGNNALFSKISGTNNTAVGNAAVESNTTGIGNTGIGAGALANSIGGDYNTVIGYNAGQGITTGTKNTIIGANLNGLAAGLSNNIIFADGDGAIRAQHDATFWKLNSFGPVTIALSSTAPSAPVACTTPTVTWSNGTATFQIDVGSTCAGISTLAVTMPAVTNAWSCNAMNVTTSATAAVEMTASTTTSTTFTNYTRTTGVALAWVDGADVRISCLAG